MTRLSVNVNKVATLRNTRTIGIPSVMHAALLCLRSGAHGITVHPRPDERHIRPHDVVEIAELMREFPAAEYNLEGNPFHGYMEHARRVRPTQCTLVPDTLDAFTSNQGWDLRTDGERLRPVIAELKGLGCRVSLFMDAGTPDLPIAAQIGADRIELYTEPYAAAADHETAAGPFAITAREATAFGLGINAGHDLNRDNLGAFLRGVPGVEEVSIGHALIADALESGLPATVREYLRIIAEAA